MPLPFDPEIDRQTVDTVAPADLAEA